MGANRFAPTDSTEETPNTQAIAYVEGRVPRPSHQTIRGEALPTLSAVEQSRDDIEAGLESKTDILMQLQETLDRETIQRRLLERRLQELAEQVEKLERATPAGTQAASAQHQGENVAVEAQTPAARQAARFLAAGFDVQEATELTRRMEEVEMEQLYLRDRARREGWLRTPEFRKARNDLRNQLKEEMGEEVYDRFLYATDRDNRVIVDSVLENSPGEEIGLQPGDIILGYDDERVFSFYDLRRESARGTAGDLVPLRVERDGEILEFDIPRGPLGVRLNSLSVLPNQDGIDTTPRRRRLRRL